jgi:hypothetical protein
VGVLTETMTRLREEIGGSRRARVSSAAARIREAAERRSRVSALCAGFARDRMGARRAWFGRTPATPIVPGPAAQPPVETSPASLKPQSKGTKRH